MSSLVLLSVGPRLLSVFDVEGETLGLIEYTLISHTPRSRITLATRSTPTLWFLTLLTDDASSVYSRQSSNLDINGPTGIDVGRKSNL